MTASLTLQVFSVSVSPRSKAPSPCPCSSAWVVSALPGESSVLHNETHSSQLPTRMCLDLSHMTIHMCSWVCVRGFPAIANHHRLSGLKIHNYIHSLLWSKMSKSRMWKQPLSPWSSMAEASPCLFQLLVAAALPCPVALFLQSASELTLPSILFLVAVSLFSYTDLCHWTEEIQNNFLITKSHLWSHFLSKIIYKGSRTDLWQPPLSLLFHVVSMHKVCFFVSSEYSTELLSQWSLSHSWRSEQASSAGSLLRVMKSIGRCRQMSIELGSQRLHHPFRHLSNINLAGEPRLWAGNLLEILLFSGCHLPAKFPWRGHNSSLTF